MLCARAVHDEAVEDVSDDDDADDPEVADVTRCMNKLSLMPFRQRLTVRLKGTMLLGNIGLLILDVASFSAIIILAMILWMPLNVTMHST